MILAPFIFRFLSQNADISQDGPLFHCDLPWNTPFRRSCLSLLLPPVYWAAGNRLFAWKCAVKINDSEMPAYLLAMALRIHVDSYQMPGTRWIQSIGLVAIHDFGQFSGHTFQSHVNNSSGETKDSNEWNGHSCNTFATASVDRAFFTRDCIAVHFLHDTWRTFRSSDTNSMNGWAGNYEWDWITHQNHLSHSILISLGPFTLFLRTKRSHRLI